MVKCSQCKSWNDCLYIALYTPMKEIGCDEFPSIQELVSETFQFLSIKFGLGEKETIDLIYKVNKKQNSDFKL